ncbi:MAG: class I SAM-dependent methyltransferase [Pyrinomonadaceae bacterium]
MHEANQSQFETINLCPLCGGQGADLLFWNYDRLYELPGKFGTYACRRCGLIRLSPRPKPSAMGAYYPEEYAAYNHHFFSPEGRSGGASFLRRLVRRSVFARMGYATGPLHNLHKLLGLVTVPMFQKRATYGYGDIIPKFVPNGRVLEVGCGDGRFLAILKHHGWWVQGIDLSPIAAQRAKDEFDIDVFVGQVEHAKFEPGIFDHIHLSHVLEHFYDPVETLRQLKTLLKATGTMFIEVPNAGGAEAEIAGQLWYGWDAPRHLFMFDPSILTNAVETAGLHVIKLQTVPCHTFEWAITFKKEEELGVVSDTRPVILTEEETFEVRNKIDQAEAIYASDQNKGERILCWIGQTGTSGKCK